MHIFVGENTSGKTRQREGFRRFGFRTENNDRCLGLNDLGTIETIPAGGATRNIVEIALERDVLFVSSVSELLVKCTDCQRQSEFQRSGRLMLEVILKAKDNRVSSFIV